MRYSFMIVDDEPDVEALVSQRYRKEIRQGTHTFHFARDGVDALERMRAVGDVSVVVTDLNMPRMDGLRLMEELNDQPDPPAVVVVSAYGDMKNIRSAMNKGAFDFLTKPIDLEDFSHTLERARSFRERLAAILRERAEAQRNQAQLSRYFSPSVIQAVTESGSGLDSRAEWMEATFVFTDITDFLPFVERTEPSQVVDVLGVYFGDMIDIIFGHGGTLMKITGDAMQIMFGAPEVSNDHAAQAVKCALALDSYARGFCDGNLARGTGFGRTRIGVHTGRALVGNFGGSRFFDYTAYGPDVNIAARLESANKVIGTTALVSETTAKAIPGFRGRRVGELRLKGASGLVSAFEPCATERFSDHDIHDYEAAYRLLKDGKAEARDTFAELIARRSDDELSAFQLSRILGRKSETEIVAF